MATFCGEKYVAEQLRSILDQLGPDDEVIVSDDASTDGTVAVVRGLADPRVRVVENVDNLGYTGNFERALTLARGDLVFLADQDDVWLPGKVQRLVNALADHDLVVSDVRVVDADLRTLEASHFDRYGVRSGFLANFVATRYVGAAMAFRRSVLTAALPFPRRHTLCAHDYWIAVVAEAFGRVGLVAEPLMLYRRHADTTSTGGESTGSSVVHKLAVRGYCLASLARRARSARRLFVAG